MNPSLKLILILIISLEISFTHRLVANLILLLIALIILVCINHVHYKTLVRLILVPLIPALALAITIRWFSPSHSTFFAIILVTRLYAYCFLGALITVSTSPLTLARSLEQNLHLPAKYAYGTLAAVNMIPRTFQNVKTIRQAALMRGINLSFWSPRLYFKAVLSAINWADNLAQAMESQGFVEGRSRTQATFITISHLDWLIFFSCLLIFQLILVTLP